MGKFVFSPYLLKPVIQCPVNYIVIQNVYHVGVPTRVRAPCRPRRARDAASNREPGRGPSAGPLPLHGEPRGPPAPQVAPQLRAAMEGPPRPQQEPPSTRLLHEGHRCTQGRFL